MKSISILKKDLNLISSVLIRDLLLEIMQREDITTPALKDCLGLAHFSFSVGSKEAVLELTEQLRKDGFVIESEPRTTGDGYFESVILDPEGNIVEITI